MSCGSVLNTRASVTVDVGVHHLSACGGVRHSRSSANPFLYGFMAVPWHKHESIIGNSELTQSLFYFPLGDLRGFGAESSNPLITWFLWQAKSILKLSRRLMQSHLININSSILDRDFLGVTKEAPLIPVTHEVSRILGALLQQPGQKLDISLLLYHNIVLVNNEK